MKNKKPISTEKLRKMRIWPSILSCVLTLLMIAGLVTAFMLVFFEYVSQAKITASYFYAKDVADELNARVYGENLPTVMEEIGNNAEKNAGFAVVDERGAVLASYGTLSYNHFDVIEIPTNKELVGYLDIYSEGESLTIQPAVVIDAVMNVPDGEYNDNNDATIYEVIYWLELPLKDNNRFLLTKTKLTVAASDVHSVLVVGVIGFMITFIPFILMIINIVMMIKTQRRFTALFYHDNVTDGYNWAYFKARSLKLLKKRKVQTKLYAVVDFELTKFRRYSALHGAEQGEQLLKNINEYLEQIIAPNEVAAHYARSNFALLLAAEEKEELIRRIYEIMGQLSNADGGTRLLHYHAGVRFFRTGNKFKLPRISELFAHASAAGTTIDGTDENMVAVFNQDLLDNQVWEQYVIDSVDKAIANEEFKVYLQPKFNPVTETLEGAEALVRWINDEYGFISPGKFIPILEKTGLIVKLDDYMLAHVAQLQSRWIAEGRKTVHISVNVSRAHFARADLAEHIKNIVDTYKTPHELVEIELTESAFFDDKKLLISTVKRLKEYGFAVSMDDFGAGYSSLNSLKDLSLDVLKLDADFFRGDDGEKRGEIVISEAICLAKRLEMQIVAEGIEKKEQVDFLAQCGCDLIQGYYFAKPMPVEEYMTLAYDESKIGGSQHPVEQPAAEPVVKETVEPVAEEVKTEAEPTPQEKVAEPAPQEAPAETEPTPQEAPAETEPTPAPQEVTAEPKISADASGFDAPPEQPETVTDKIQGFIDKALDGVSKTVKEIQREINK